MIKLTSVYTRLSMEKVQELCGFSDVKTAKNILITMITEGILSATIDADNVVTFIEDTKQSSQTDADMLNKMQNKIQNLLELWNSLDKAQLEIKKNPNYIRKTINFGNQGQGGSGSGPGMEQDLQQQMLLEQMMSGAGFFTG